MTTQTASSAQRSRLAVGYVMGALGSILFATKGIAITLAYAEGVDTETLLALRMLLSLPFYAVVGILSVRGRQQGTAVQGGDKTSHWSAGVVLSVAA